MKGKKIDGEHNIAPTILLIFMKSWALRSKYTKIKVWQYIMSFPRSQEGLRKQVGLSHAPKNTYSLMQSSNCFNISVSGRRNGHILGSTSKFIQRGKKKTVLTPNKPVSFFSHRCFLMLFQRAKTQRNPVLKWLWVFQDWK